MRRVAVVSVSRSDYGIARPILGRIAAEDDLEALLLVSGTHLSEEHGLTVAEIEAEGMPIAERVRILESGDGPVAAAATMAAALRELGAAYDRLQPDLVLAIGDRIEMLAAVAAALPFALPVAHVHGGESTAGAVDDQARHAITKLSHLHFAATESYARRLVQMGEEPWRVTVTGAPALDNIVLLRDVELTEAPPSPFLLVTWHPVTLEPDRGLAELEALLGALDDVGLPALVTAPGADPGSESVAERLRAYAAERPDVVYTASLGTQGYFAAMRRAAAMVGNSSSGIVESASFDLPVVNIGRRQEGRVHAENVLDVSPGRERIAEAIRHVITDGFRASLTGLRNPYGDGHASEKIVDVLRSVPLGDSLVVKRFHEVAWTA